jgi:hypothetical protein
VRAGLSVHVQDVIVFERSQCFLQGPTNFCVVVHFEITYQVDGS